jgi:hypothetical protein
MLASCKYRRSLLKKGDAVVMDSRTLHFGDANESSEGKRRVLLYFTIRKLVFAGLGVFGFPAQLGPTDYGYGYIRLIRSSHRSMRQMIRPLFTGE